MGKDDDFRKAARKAQGRQSAKIDQQLAEIRGWWERWSIEDRQEVKDWVDRAYDLVQAQPDLMPLMTLRLSLLEPRGEENYGTTPSIEILKAALDEWCKGEEYAPPASIKFLCY